MSDETRRFSGGFIIRRTVLGDLFAIRPYRILEGRAVRMRYVEVRKALDRLM